MTFCRAWEKVKTDSGIQVGRPSRLFEEHTYGRTHHQRHALHPSGLRGRGLHLHLFHRHDLRHHLSRQTRRARSLILSSPQEKGVSLREGRRLFLSCRAAADAETAPDGRAFCHRVVRCSAQGRGMAPKAPRWHHCGVQGWLRRAKRAVPSARILSNSSMLFSATSRRASSSGMAVMSQNLPDTLPEDAPPWA